MIGVDAIPTDDRPCHTARKCLECAFGWIFGIVSSPSADLEVQELPAPATSVEFLWHSLTR